MALSPIGQKIEEERKKRLPTLNQTAQPSFSLQLPQEKTLDVTAFSTPKSNVQEAKILPQQESQQTKIELQPNEEDNRLSNLEKLRKFQEQGQTLSQGTPDPTRQAQEEFKKFIPFTEVLFGTGDKSDTGERKYLNEPARTISFILTDIQRKGLVNWAIEGTQVKGNPSREQLANRIDNDTQSLVDEGYTLQEAMEIAVQNVIQETQGTAQNLRDLKNPNIKLTQKEKDILWLNNTLTDVFAVLDAPIFVGSGKAVREGLTPLGKETLEVVESGRDAILKSLKETVKGGDGKATDILLAEDDKVQEYITYLEENDNISLNDLQIGVEYLQRQGKDTTNITGPINALVGKVKEEPSTFLRDPITGQFQGSTKKAPTPEPLDTTQLELSTKVVNQLEGKTIVSRQFIIDLANQPDIKQAEQLALREVLNDYPSGKIPAKEFAEKVQAQLLPLERNIPDTVARDVQDYRYEGVSLPDDIRGRLQGYSENIYISPIKNSAGDVHFSNEGIDNYFAHTRIEDMADGQTRRVIEAQSDLFQKGRLEGEFNIEKQIKEFEDRIVKEKAVLNSDFPESRMERARQQISFAQKQLNELKAGTSQKQTELSQLQPYRNTWWERIVREEVKKAAEDGKAVLQFPTGETAMKIEGLGDNTSWTVDGAGPMSVDELKVGREVYQARDEIVDEDNAWIITEVLGDGKFKAVPKNSFSESGKEWSQLSKAEQKNLTDGYSEQFDISGKVDTSNPIYKFYEKDVQKFLKKNYDAEVVTDENGVKWVQMDVNPALAGQPVQAFAGVIAGYEEDEEGNITIDPTKAFLGMAAAGILGKRFNRASTKSSKLTQAQGSLSESANRELPTESKLPSKGQTQYPLTTSKFSDSLSSEYQKVAGKSIDETLGTMQPGKIDPEQLTNYSLFNKSMGKAWTAVVENVQDNMIRVRNLVNNPNVKITEDSDPYLAEILFHGRVGARLEEARDLVVKIDGQIVADAKKNGIPDRDMSVLVNKYLHARHTPERNAKLGDGASGLTTADANIIKSEIEALPYADDVIKIADDIQELNNRTLDTLLEGQVINRELYDTLRNTYKTHVPLQRVLSDEEDIVQVISGKGFDVRSSGIQRAKGSDKDVADILANVVTNYEQAVIRAEKNLVDLTTLQFARDNKNLGLFKEVSPKVIGKMADDTPIVERVVDPTVLTLKENGKTVHLQIQDESLAMALKGVNRQQIPLGFKYIAAFTRFYSGLQTRFNPEFAFPNKIRDLQEMLVYAGSQSELGFKGGVRASLRRDAYTGVMDFVRGKETPKAQLYKQMIDDGGTTGGISLSTRQAIELDITQIRKLNRSNPRFAADKIVQSIDDFNRIFEDSTRLAVYKQALDQGASRKKAAMLAKEASVNFNKFGRGGSMINALWMFSNAGIQGTTKFIRAMKNPKVAAITTTSVFGAVAAAQEWNDTVDPEWRDKVPEWDRTNALPIVLPPSEDGDFNYFVIPVAWGLKPMKVTADYVVDYANGVKTDPKDVAGGVLGAIVNAYNPLGGSDTLSMALPTVVDIPAEIARNQAWHGGIIRPDWDERKAHLQYFTDLKDTTTGEITVGITSGLSKVGIEVSPANLYYAYQGYIGGAGRTATDAVNTLVSVGRGKMPELEDVPIVSRFLKQRDNEVLGAEAVFYRKIKDKQVEADTERAQLAFDAEDALVRLSEMSPEEARTEFDRLAASDPDLAKKVADLKKDKDMGLTYTDRAIKSLGVQNGARAEIIYERLHDLKSDEERRALWDEYVEKKIISDAVAEQLVELLNQE